MNEAYVSFDTAKLLKEKEFDWDCNAIYGRRGEFQRNTNRTFNNGGLHVTSAPTQQMACRWLREEHDIDIIPVIRHSLKYAQESPFRDYACRVYDSDGNIVMSSTKWYSRYERAVEAALQYVLKNLI